MGRLSPMEIQAKIVQLQEYITICQNEIERNYDYYLNGAEFNLDKANNKLEKEINKAQKGIAKLNKKLQSIVVY